jgi:hypothetical protein
MLNILIEWWARLPLFMDTIFTNLMTFVAGPFWGMAVAIMTAALSGAFTFEFWGTYLYVICSAAGVLLIWIFCRGFDHTLERELRRRVSVEAETGIWQDPPEQSRARFIRVISILMILSVFMCVTVSVLGGLIAFIISDILSGQETHTTPEFFFRLGLLRRNIPVLWADILGRIPVNIPDRLISVYGAYGLSLILVRFVRKDKSPRIT